MMSAVWDDVRTMMGYNIKSRDTDGPQRQHSITAPCIPPSPPILAHAITADHVSRQLRNLHPRKAAGPDKPASQQPAGPYCLPALSLWPLALDSTTTLTQLSGHPAGILRRSLHSLRACQPWLSCVPPLGPAVCAGTVGVNQHHHSVHCCFHTKLRSFAVAATSGLPRQITHLLFLRGSLCQEKRCRTAAVHNLFTNKRQQVRGPSDPTPRSPALAPPRGDSSVKLLKYADDTTLIGLIRVGDETAYKQKVERLVHWCSQNHLDLHPLKTVEMAVDFKRDRSPLPPLTILSNAIATTDTFKFLRSTISQDLKWTSHIDSDRKKAQQRLYFLRQLRKFNLPQELVETF
ncbi:uncharacterized protein ACBT44_018508 [Syngnathus typhle]